MTRIPSLLFVYVPFVRSGNGYDQSQNVFVVSYVVIAQSTNNSVFIVEQFFFFFLIKYHYLEWMKSIFNSQESTIMKKKYLQAKLRVKTRRSWKVNFSRDKIFSKIACVEISVIVHLYILCTRVFSNLSRTVVSDSLGFSSKKTCYRVGYRFVDFTGFTSDWIHPRDLRLDRGVAWSRACPRYRSRDDKRREREREKAFEVVWEN